MANVTKRPISEGMESVLGIKEYVFGDGIGYLVPVDYMGNDETIANTARTSYAEGTKQVRDYKGLIRYLMRHMHSSPFEFCEATFQLRIPLYACTQLLRHRTGNFNAESGRYSVMKEECYIPEESRMSGQSSTNKQQSGDKLPPEEATDIRDCMKEESVRVYDFYHSLLERGLARELSRGFTPQCQYVTIVFKMDAKNLMHFMKLRLGEGAQYEIKVYAQAIADIFKVWLPETFSAWEEYSLNAVTMSATEMRFIRAYLRGESTDGILDHLSKGERREFAEKLGLPSI